MHPRITLRDWTLVALTALALVTYGVSLIARGFTAEAAEGRTVHACVYSSAS